MELEHWNKSVVSTEKSSSCDKTVFGNRPQTTATGMTIPEEMIKWRFWRIIVVDMLSKVQNKCD